MTTPLHPLVEIELKLALPCADPAGLAMALAGVPALAGQQSTQHALHNLYFDTPEQALRQRRMVLRLRRIGSAASPQWRQTLKIAGSSSTALSQRGEWESAVPTAELDLTALQATPWATLDPDGSLFAALLPCFVTRFERTCWKLQQRDGSRIEVALDIGQITAGSRSAPLCELELELLAGQPDALFALAHRIARHIAVLPELRSKAARGYALAGQTLYQPLRAQPPALNAELSRTAAAQLLLREMFGQFTVNLIQLRDSDDPELVHQARVGWRRFKSTCRLFGPALVQPPDWAALRPLLSAISELRNLEVALVDTLPPLAAAYRLGRPARASQWQVMIETLRQTAQVQRQRVCCALETPAVGASLLAITQWLEPLTDAPPATATAHGNNQRQAPLGRWVRRRVVRLRRQFERAIERTNNPKRQHRSRILAKQLRYGIEALQGLLPKRRSRRWYRQATKLQNSLGQTRDIASAAALLADLKVARSLGVYLQKRRRKHLIMKT